MDNLPDPLLDKDFHELYRKEIKENEHPCLKLPLLSTETDKVNKELLVFQRVHSAIKCTNCLWPKCIYAASKLDHNAFTRLRRVQDEGSYVCGLGLFQDGPYKKTVVVRLSLSCESVMETTYYASKTVVLPDVFYYCDGTSPSPLYNNAKIKQLKIEYTKVRPICTSCIADVKEPITWEACSNLAKKKNEVKHYFLVFYVL